MCPSLAVNCLLVPPLVSGLFVIVLLRICLIGVPRCLPAHNIPETPEIAKILPYEMGGWLMVGGCLLMVGLGGLVWVG